MGVADGTKVLIKTEIIDIPRILPDKTDALYSSLYNKEFLVWYQPVFDIRSYGTYLCVKAEALLRLYSNGEVFSAYQFIDNIKKHPEFRFSLSKFVVSRVIEDSKKAYSIRLSVNLFSEDLEDDLFVDWFLSAIDKSGQKPDRFVVEVSECAGDFDRFAENIVKLKIKGLKIALDDWGKEESNLSRLLFYPDFVKIDKMFVPNEDCPDLLKCCLITQFASYIFNTETIIEGIENKYQLQIAKTLGIDKAQDFFWSEAIPLEKLIRDYING